MKCQLLPALAGSLVLALASPNASPGAAIQSLYGQCGGESWTGATTCAAGSSCQSQNPYYSQCLAAATAPAPSVNSSPTGAPSPTTFVTSAAASEPAGPATASGTPAPAGNGSVLKASFTEYGSTDHWGSGNCNTNSAACGFYTSPGFSAALSQNYYGAGPGAGAGPACGTCWLLTPETDSTGKPLSGAKSIVVKVNNLCPAQGNPLCAQNGLDGTNEYGAVVNFDTCIDSGASSALFGSSGSGLALGTAQQVDCSQWSGTDISKRMAL